MITNELKVTYCTEKGWRVDKDGKYIDHLTWDEMLAQFVGLSIPHTGDFFGMRTPEEWEIKEYEFKKRIEDNCKEHELQVETQRTAVLKLRNEINCRIEHGADSRGHLEYVQSKLDEILKEAKS